MEPRQKIITGTAAAVAVLGIAIGGSALASGGRTTTATTSDGTEHAANGGSGQLGRPGTGEPGRPEDDHVDGGHERPGRGQGPGGFGHPGEEELAGAALATVTAAVATQLPGSTILRAESNGDGSGYHVLAQTADGEAAMVLLDADFAVIRVLTRGSGGPGGPGAPGDLSENPQDANGTTV